MLKGEHDRIGRETRAVEDRLATIDAHLQNESPRGSWRLSSLEDEVMSTSRKYPQDGVQDVLVGDPMPAADR
jgi:hypothetical protein